MNHDRAVTVIRDDSQQKHLIIAIARSSKSKTAVNG